MDRVVASIAAAAVLIAATPLMAQSDQTLKRTVKKDTETMVNVHANSFKPRPSMLNCEQGGTVVIEITSPPKNGTVTTRPTKTKDKDCSNELMGTGIYYKPKPGFTGSDTFTYVRTEENMRAVSKAGGPQGSRVINITVQP